ncbi:hypothetical protein ACFFIX_22345 [Metabacillus herbersteinensis]|uniref:Uncharacterized protein n=1 Tax=Metabacillus herbersteinensis TaxID=283816 RepID=A0ABV6GMF1_9BACI
MIKTQTKVNEKEFEVFTTIQLPISIKVKGENYQEAFNKAMSQLDEYAIAQVYLTLMLNNGEIISPKVHNWETPDGIEAVFEEE